MAVPYALVDGDGKVVTVIMIDPMKDRAPEGYRFVACRHKRGAALVDSRYVYDEKTRSLEPNTELKAERAAREAETARRKAIIDAEAARDPAFLEKIEADPAILERLLSKGRS